MQKYAVEKKLLEKVLYMHFKVQFMFTHHYLNMNRT